MRKLIALTGCLVALAVGTSSAHAENTRQMCPRVLDGIQFYKTATWKWQDKLGIHRTHPEFRVIRSCEFAQWAASRWRQRAKQTRASYVKRVLTRPAHLSAWLCIHQYEGAWNANTGNGYYGGLQMDMSFQQHYGAKLLAVKGTANNWTPLEQMWVAETALQAGRGFYPWPNTARACGLI